MSLSGNESFRALWWLHVLPKVGTYNKGIFCA